MNWATFVTYLAQTTIVFALLSVIGFALSALVSAVIDGFRGNARKNDER
jgi:hypothetical protein